jgi:hypothetical protein
MANLIVSYLDAAGNIASTSTALPATSTRVLEEFVDRFDHVVLSIHTGDTCLYRSAVQPADFAH